MYEVTARDIPPRVWRRTWLVSETTMQSVVQLENGTAELDSEVAAIWKDVRVRIVPAARERVY